MYKIQFSYSPVYELITSLYTYINIKQHKNGEMTKQWKEETKQTLTKQFADELENEKWEVLHRTVLLISKCPKNQSVEDFLSWFENISTGELYDRLAPWVHTIPLNLQEIRDKSVYILSEWNDQYFSKLDPTLFSELEQRSKQNEELAKKENPSYLLNTVSNGLVLEPTETLNEVILVPQYHMYPYNVLDFHRGMATLLYPYKKMTPHEEKLESILKKSQGLADKSRLDILLLLTKGNHTLTSIQEKTGLAKSTVHHHLTLLGQAGLINRHYYGSSQVAFYSLRPSSVEDLTKHFHSIGLC
ncbi:metalloregulator ArsR/SmtB family transcription factor [Bacillus sp. FJAT-49736]|uniref:ArsR/SmtB family transcription factor n=1 Tax=Bacillus sp. FJAT-49736 TaxID=2833582 RepID=UPI001BCA3FAA|nr:metalloregulator ArsR/SmtB family transcription factor [Bacillus sp. FJAT-49736]MBS4174746.1 winged helix-turn-helix transcriptional regulator [Bacillus sp. FJAT-49736]